MSSKTPAEAGNSVLAGDGALSDLTFILSRGTDDCLDYVRESALSATEIPNAGNHQEDNADDRNRQILQGERMLSPEDAPPETIDDTDHWIYRVEQAPFLRNYIAQEADWGEI